MRLRALPDDPRKVRTASSDESGLGRSRPFGTSCTSPCGVSKASTARQRRLTFVLIHRRQAFPTRSKRPGTIDVIEIEGPIDLPIGKFARFRVIDKHNQQLIFLAEDGAKRRLTPAHNLNTRVVVDDDAVAIPGRDVDAWGRRRSCWRLLRGGDACEREDDESESSAYQLPR